MPCKFEASAKPGPELPKKIAEHAKARPPDRPGSPHLLAKIKKAIRKD